MPAQSLSPNDILGSSGRIAARLEHYEERPEQLAMADAVARAIADASICSSRRARASARALPIWCRPFWPRPTNPPRGPRVEMERGYDDKEKDDADAEGIRRIVISTHTISLQEQLMEKDLPLLGAVMPIEFTAVLVKGRSNYLSLRRMKNAVDRAGSLFYDHRNSSSFAIWSLGARPRATARFRS